MRRVVSVRLHYVAVTSNVLALGIQLWGMARPLQALGQMLAVFLTAISAACWLRYFRQLSK